MVDVSLAFAEHDLEVARNAVNDAGIAPAKLTFRRDGEEADGAELRAALARECEGQLELLASADVKEGVRAFLERRTPVFRGV